jgi:hypothetical protein
MAMRILLRVVGMLAFSSLTAAAQSIAVGVTGGVRTTDDVSGSLTPESKRYIVGPTVDVRLPLRLSVEVDALYQRFGFSSYECAPGGLGCGILRERANSWEFPMVLKYHLPVRLAHPFAGVGYAPRIVHGTDVSSGYSATGVSENPEGYIYTYYNYRFPTNYAVTQGVVVSGGLNLGTGHLWLTPEVRYVHWNAPFLNQQGADGRFAYVSKQNEFFVMLGISWH